MIHQPSRMASSESLTVAQILANLSDLQNTVRVALPIESFLTKLQDSTAAHALLVANKTLLNSRTLRRKQRQNSLPDRPQFDAGKFGKRITEPRNGTPSLNRMESSTSGKSAGSSGPQKSSDGSSDVVSAPLVYRTRC